MEKMNKCFTSLLSFLIMLFISFSCSAQDWGDVRYVHSPTNIRAGRSANSKIVSKIDIGNQIKVDFLQDNWFAVFGIDETNRDENKALGYVYAPLLKPNPFQPIQSSEKTQSTLAYNIVEKKDISARGYPRMVYRVVVKVNRIPLKEQLKKIAFEIWNDDNRGWKQFTVFIYLPNMDTDWGAYGIAEFSPKGLNKFEVNENALLGTKWIDQLMD